MLRNRIGFAIWAVLVVLCFVATGSFLSSVFLLGTIVVLLFSYVSIAKSKNRLHMELIAPEQIKANKKKSIKISLHNTSAYPVFSIKGRIVCKNQETNAVEEMPFNTSLKGYMKEELPVKIRSEEEGCIEITVKDVEIKDMFGIFVYKPEITATTTVNIQKTSNEVVETQSMKQQDTDNEKKTVEQEKETTKQQGEQRNE